jgi:ankyrin repeat protein
MTVHRTHPPTRAMRETPDIEQLKRQARELLEAYRAQSPDAVIEVAAHHRTATPETFALHDAQFVLARSYGFESWPKLKAAVDGVTTTRLHEAVKRGDLGAARALLARRPEIVDLLRGGPSGFEIRALHIAVMQRDVEMTRLLLEAGADTRGGIWPNRDATSPHTIAEERGYDEIVAMMVGHEEKRGARGGNAFDDGFRRLRQAMMTGGEEAVIAVFESQPALADICPPDGVTMLHRAAGQGTLLVAKWLLDHGADVNRKSHPDFWRREGRTPLDFAAWECAEKPSRRATCEAMAALLIERGAALTPFSASALGRSDYLASCPLDSLQGKGLLQAAVRNDRPAVVHQLLDMGMDPDERTQLGQHEDQTFSAGGPLLEAVNTGRIDMARVLLDRGADPNAQVYTAGSPTAAAYSGGSPRLHGPDPAMIDLMVQHGGWLGRRLHRVPTQRGPRTPHARWRARPASGVRHVLGSDGRRTDPVGRREWPERGHRAHGAGADRLAAGRPAMVLDAVASAARVPGPERRRTGGLPRVVSADSRALRSQSSGRGIWPDDAARSDRARSWSGRVSGVHPAGCGGAHGRPGRILEEYTPRVGVSLGPYGDGHTAAGSRGRSDRARGRAVAHTARVGRTGSTCGYCIHPPATRS